MRVDLHMHSTASDGTQTPAQMAQECKKAGLSHAALTDHDCITGVREFLQEAEKLGLRAIPGVEFSVEYPGERISGYGVGLEQEAFSKACQMLAAAGRAAPRRWLKSSAGRDMKSA